MEPKGAPTGPIGRPSAGEPVLIWFRVGLPCSPAPNGLVGDGAPRPVKKGFRGLAARGVLTSESRLTKEEAEEPRKDSGVRQGRASFPDCSASPRTPRSRASESFMPFCLQLGLVSPNGSSSTGLLDFPVARAWAPSRLSFGSVDSRGLANGSKDEAPPRAEVSEVSREAPQGSVPVLGSLRLGELGAQGSAMGDPAGSTGALPQGSEEERVGSKSQGWLRDRACPEGTGDQGSAEGPQEEPLGSVFGLRPGMSHGSAEQCVEGRAGAGAKMSAKSRMED